MDEGSYIDWRGERVLARTLGSKGVDCEISHRLERGKIILYKGMETFP